MIDKLFISLCFVNLLANSAYSSIAPFFPEIAVNKGILLDQIGLIFCCYSISYFVVSPIVGKIMHYVSRKKVLLFGIILEAVAMFSFAFIIYIEDKTVFGIVAAVTRFIEGAGNGCLTTASYAIIASHYTENIDSVLATTQIFTGVGMLLGPLIGSFFYTFGGFMAPFIIVGTMLLLLCFTLTFSIPLQNSTASPVKKSRKTVGYIEILKNSFVVFITLSAVLTLTHLTFKEPILQIRCIQEYNLSVQVIGFIFTMDTISFTLGSLISRKVSQNFDKIYYINLGLILVSFGTFLIGPSILLHLPNESSIYIVITGIVINGFGAAFCLNSGVPVMLKKLKNKYHYRMEEVNNIISGIFNAGVALGEIIGPSMGGYLDSRYGFRDAFSILGLFIASFTIIFTIYTFVFNKRTDNIFYSDGYMPMEEDSEQENYGDKSQTSESMSKRLSEPNIKKLPYPMVRRTSLY